MQQVGVLSVEKNLTVMGYNLINLHTIHPPTQPPQPLKVKHLQVRETRRQPRRVGYKHRWLNWTANEILGPRKLTATCTPNRRSHNFTISHHSDVLSHRTLEGFKPVCHIVWPKVCFCRAAVSVNPLKRIWKRQSSI